MICPKCSTSNPNEAKYCLSCGFAFFAVAPDPEEARRLKREASGRRLSMIGVAFLVILFFVTFALSPLLVAKNSSLEEIVLQPSSYYAVRFDFYGVGFLRYSAGQMSGQNVISYEFSEANYHRFVEGESFHSGSYGQIGYGGNGESTEAGTIWVRYIVFVNQGPDPVTMQLGYESYSVFSLLIAGPLAAGLLLLFLLLVVATRRRE